MELNLNPYSLPIADRQRCRMERARRAPSLVGMVPKHILGFNGTSEARDALRLSDQLAELEDAQIVVVNALEIPTLPVSAIDPDPGVFARSNETVQMGVEALGHRTAQARLVASSSAARALHDVAETEHAELIVIGSASRAGLGRIVPGSVGSRLLQGAPCAVAMAPRGYARREHFGLSVIGVGFDGGEESQLALAHARRLALDSKSRLRIIGAIADPADHRISRDEHAKLRADLEERLMAAADFAGKPDASGRSVSVETRVLVGDAPAVLADQGIELDLLVVGSRGYGPVLRTIVGGVSERVMKLAPCPVLVVPRGEHSHSKPHLTKQLLTSAL